MDEGGVQLNSYFILRSMQPFFHQKNCIFPADFVTLFYFLLKNFQGLQAAVGATIDDP